MYDDAAGIIGSFIPFLLVNRRKGGDFVEYMLRVIVAIIIFFTAAYYIEVFSVDEVLSIYNDTFDWTKDKIVGNNTHALTVKGGTRYGSLDDILRETQEMEEKEKQF